MKDTQLVFVVGSGRCGTKMIKSLLAGTGIEARHEYVRNAYQRESAMYYMGSLSYDEMAGKLREISEPAAYYSQSKIFLDSSQHLTWCVDVLADVFPDAKFIHLVRDGRKVVSSYFYKLNLFDDYANNVMWNWVKNGGIIPPREEKFWMPSYGEKFDRICRHWVSSNHAAWMHLKNVSSIFVRLEDLATSSETMNEFLSLLDIPYNGSFLEAMQKPKHVYTPINYKLTDEQTERFAVICGDMMKLLGYDMESEEYLVHYQM